MHEDRITFPLIALRYMMERVWRCVGPRRAVQTVPRTRITSPDRQSLPRGLYVAVLATDSESKIPPDTAKVDD